MSAKAVFLDKDDTLVEDVPYNVDPERIRLSAGALDALGLLQEQGYQLIVVTNQSGVARGYFGEADLKPVEERLHQLLASAGILLSGFYYCPHYPGGKVSRYAVACDCRKPAPGLIEHAAEIASAASSVAVTKSGTSVCSLDELKEFFSTGEKVIDDIFQLALRVALYRRTGRRIVFTNGCFDILHRGHITYLNRAKALGDILIVGLNSDRSVRSLKGPSRPVNSLEDRAQVLAALSCVDHIVPFDGPTPHELIRRIKPDIFVKGGDYTRETLPEASLVEELGGRVEILPYLESYSTTRVIEKIHHPSLQARD